MLGLAALAWTGWFALGFAEPEEMSTNGLMARIFVPEALRESLPDTSCQPARISRALMECGGICGESFTVRIGTPEGSDLAARLATKAGTPDAWHEFVDLSSQDDGGGLCPEWTFRMIYWNEGFKP